ncbi:MAG: hypothetical protein JWN26_126 [Candidatus Saccharibacteria bacterium]|nr:hypothetical protein [Candidatus Saccharibacteria bacterium]
MGEIAMTVQETESKLNRYRQPSSSTEQEKQATADRLVKQAVDAWLEDAPDGVRIKYVPKGSYTNNTNVRQDSDVDIAVVRTDFHYFDADDLNLDHRPVGSPTTYPLEGILFRNSLASSIKAHFGDNCDTTGSTAIQLRENGGHVSADIVPAFTFRKYYYDAVGSISYHVGEKVFKTDGTSVVNYPDQQLENGRTKNVITGGRYKHMVRILKNAENDLVLAGKINELPSYFMECLIYCVPNDRFNHEGNTPLRDDLIACIAYIYDQTTSPNAPAANWLEPNEIKSLFGSGQKWTIEQAHDLAFKVWVLFDLGEEE